jgi:hypothetical protein
MERFDIIRGEFRPRRKDNLRPWAEGLVGRVFEWEAAWVIESGPYAGEWALLPRDKTGFPYGWVPASDVIEVPNVRAERPQTAAPQPE